ncbi:hypothetical protein D3C85_1592920 [compost metagenome]
MANSAISASTGTPRRASMPCSASVPKNSPTPSLPISAITATPAAIRPMRNAMSISMLERSDHKALIV